MEKIRLDLLMVEHGLIESRALAQKLVMAGQVRVNGEVVYKPSTRVPTDSKLVIDQGPPFVSRGGEKLEAGLKSFGLTDLTGVVCADVGASTGGFTDCLLKGGASKVYAIDVGYGVLHWKLRNDPRVVSMEKTNARNIQKLPEQVNLVTIDASFISLKIILPVVKEWFGGNGGKVIALIKPQFEAGREEAAKGEGVIRDPQIHRRILTEIIDASGHSGYSVHGIIRSPLIGPKGNMEFLINLNYPHRTNGETNTFLDSLFPTGLSDSDANFI